MKMQSRKLFQWAAMFILFHSWILPGKEATQTLHLVQDDAQDYMVSKAYVLKHIQSNDIWPFVTSIIKRYNMNSSADCLSYGQNNEQILTVTCPEGMMPYVDDFIAKADRNVKIHGKVPGEIIRGTGITRCVYQPKYRSGQVLVNMIVNAMINAGPYGSVYAYDANSNQIYWKDNISNSEFSAQFLTFLDRSIPQIHLTLTLYEIRESVLRDLGLDYLAWKNGPGLNLFQAAWRAFDLSSVGSAAMQGLSGPVGGFFFAPQFDFSFIRILEQNGKAQIVNSAELSVSNSDSNSYQISFNPQFQNIIKSENDQSSVGISAASSLENAVQTLMVITSPVVCLHNSTDEVEFELVPYEAGQYAGKKGTLCFSYSIQSAGSVERNNYGAELIDISAVNGSVCMELEKEKLLASWDRSMKVTQTIGVPFLSRIPLLKYLFSTETTTEEKSHVYLTVRGRILNTAKSDAPCIAGKLTKLK